MKWLKRTAAAGMTAVMLFSCLPAAGAVQPGEELTRGETASILLEAATDYNADVTYGDILKGYPGGDLNEDGAVTRASLVLGIIAVVFWFFGYSSILSVILGIVGLIQASKAKELGYLDAIRTAGFVLSLIGLIGGALAFVACVACVSCAGIASTLPL